MDKAIVSGDSSSTEMSAEELQDWYKAGTDLLKIRASYVFLKLCHDRWGVGTWSKAVLPSKVMKFGTETDKMALPAPSSQLSFCNRRKWTTKGQKRAEKERTRHPHCTTATPIEHQQVNNPPYPPPPPPPEPALTDKEKHQLVSTSREDTLEAAVAKYIRHSHLRIAEEGEANVSPTPMEALALRHRATPCAHVTNNQRQQQRQRHANVTENRRQQQRRRPYPIEVDDSSASSSPESEEEGPPKDRQRTARESSNKHTITPFEQEN